MTSKSLDKAWREFELLVADIERALSPIGAVVKSPDLITNNLTKKKREVDASIRYSVGTVPILITIECRRRKHKQDDTWIEQLVSKKQNLGAAKTIAVTTQGISDQAKTDAQFYGIEVRQIKEITQDDMIGWIKIEEIVKILQQPIIEGDIDLEMYAAAGTEGRLHPNVIKLTNENPGSSKVFVREADKKNFSLEEIVTSALRLKPNMMENPPLDDSLMRKRLKIKIPKGMLSILCESGYEYVAQISLGVDIHYAVESVPISEAGFSYTGEGTQDVYGVRATTDFFGNAFDISLISKKGSDLLNVTVTKRKLAKSRRQ